MARAPDLNDRQHAELLAIFTGDQELEAEMQKPTGPQVPVTAEGERVELARVRPSARRTERLADMTSIPIGPMLDVGRWMKCQWDVRASERAVSTRENAVAELEQRFQLLARYDEEIGTSQTKGRRDRHP